MTLLANFPLVNQRATVTGDGRPSENALFDCVAACIDALCRYLLGTPENSVFNPDHFKDAAYGEAWKNDGTDAARYVTFCQSLGIKLFSENALNYGHAIALAHQLIQQGKPCIFTELDPYVDTRLPQYAGWTHACAFFGEDAQGLTALDPFIGKAVYKSDQGWVDVLRSNQLWIAEKIVVASAISPIPVGWRDDGATLLAPNNVKVVHGFRDWVLTHTWSKDNWPVDVEQFLPSLEASNPSLGAGSQQLFRFSMLGWTKERGVFEEWVGVELAYLRKSYAAIYAWSETVKAAWAIGQAQPPQ
jgi:hypothetical protein